MYVCMRVCVYVCVCLGGGNWGPIFTHRIRISMKYRIVPIVKAFEERVRLTKI